MTDSGWNQRFGGIRWRVTPNGIETDSEGPMRTAGEPTTVRLLLEQWGRMLKAIARVTRVPLPILIMTVLTEGALKWNPAKNELEYPLYRKEPGYVDDKTTPHRISIGPMHILLSNYRQILGTPKASSKDAANLLDNLFAGALFIAEREGIHRFDPILVAASYNAGGLYDASDPKSKYHNRWHLRTYGNHLDRAARWYGDAVFVLAEQDHPAFHDPDIAVPLTRPKIRES